MVSIECRYYILSIESNAQTFAQAVRSHWSIENNLHWILDVGFGEDTAKGCQGYSPENLAVIRHVGINLLSKDKTTKVGMKTKRLKAGWDNRYLEDVLNALNVLTT
jgi:predicted transposase YbfD/YdcC